ncbi:Bug family tripartite tricarboxylate transporter substrate binding protein [Polynucleobacter sinensis]|uniref:Bug family tripartite tricarboxylate transporter substrate binding protein n=1 Tax=Polynucleobacter sinensis TaxID=1743157 RepID=UPI000785A142|nr:tripartite tricarboxylate transporter substrate binding protein [Polynucleobacter sinensis]
MNIFNSSLSRRTMISTGLLMMSAFLLGNVAAQSNYPNKPITVIVPYAPGGQGDMFARAVGERLTRSLGQTVLVDNKPGASGALGARLVSKARGDGYTLILGQTGEMAVNSSAMKNPGYDNLKDFEAIALVGNSPLVLVVPANSPYNSLSELIQAARNKPGSISYASSGTATPGHLAAAALAAGTKTDMVHVPYKGAGQAITDLIGGQVQFFFSSASAVSGHIKSGNLKALAVSSKKRIPSLPKVPTVAEAALPGFEFSLWGGYFAPRETPPAIINQLNSEISKALSDPELKARLESDGVMIEPMSPASFESFVRAETEKYARLVKLTNSQLD